MGRRATPEAKAVADAFGHLHIDVTTEGSRVRLATGDLIEVHFEQRGPGTNQILVSHQITPSTRKRLTRDGIGWLDLTGHLSYRSPGLVVDADVPGLAPMPNQRSTLVLDGRVVSAVTCTALAAWPERLDGVRATARAIDATPAGVSYATRRLIHAGYLTSDLRATSALFWAAASEWRPHWIEMPLRVMPTDGVVGVGAVAAGLVGAPVALTTRTKPEFLVASEASLKYAAMAAQNIHSDAPTGRFAVAPATAAVEALHPSGVIVHGAPVASEAIVALTLAVDPARGAETVRSWDGEHAWS